MADFFMISTRSSKRGHIEIYPKFIIRNPSSDLMIKGGDFYAVWVEDRGLWSTSEQDLIDLIDHDLDAFAKEHENAFDGQTVHVMHMWDADSGSADRWHKYCKQQMRDSYHALDEKLVFANTEAQKSDYASKRLPYPIEGGPCPSWEKLMSVLYSPEEQRKIEWAIGAVVSGDSKKIQKFVVFFGEPGTGKSTVLDIIQQLFAGHYCMFSAKALGNPNDAFALEPFAPNPLVAIEQDADLSRIEDNTRLNSIASHDEITVNEKHKNLYSARFNCFMFIGTNKPVKITDAKSGIIRRLIDISPTGKKLPFSEYDRLTTQVKFELGAIAKRCLDVYEADPRYYDHYVPTRMMLASNDFYNYVLEYFTEFEKADGVSLQLAWDWYNKYCIDAAVPFKHSRRVFGEELKSYFREFSERGIKEDGTRVRNWYSGFRKEKFVREELTENPPNNQQEVKSDYWFVPKEQKSLFDILAADYPAQYASEEGIPKRKWENVKTTLKDLDSHELHYVKVPINHIVIDFDIPDEQGNKCLEKNLEAVSRWPPTYGELSKSGQGIHLHYIYKGDPEKLSRVYDDKIEIKVFTGNMTLRRKLSKCNDLQIAEISSGLPLKGEDKLVNQDAVKNEKAIRTLIKRNLMKEYHPGTKPSVDFIKKILDDAYDSGVKYDVRDLQKGVLDFAKHSTNHADYCEGLVGQMHFCSEELPDSQSQSINDAIDELIERSLRNEIKKTLTPDGNTDEKEKLIYIKTILDEAYASGSPYDVSDLFNPILIFASNSTHHADYCTKLVSEMKFRSEEESATGEFPGAAEEAKNGENNINNDILIFFDVEVFVNLFVICWKKAGPDEPVIRMINPTPAEVEDLMRYRLVGFNCRQYDNHILYARTLGYSEEQLYHLSQSIINAPKGSRNAGMFGNAYNVSYTDILDFSSEKKSLKKFEIDLGIHHQELGLPWDQPVPEELWEKVAEYCVNDVVATEAVWNSKGRQADFMARQIQVELVKALHGIQNVSVNDTTNSLSEKIIFGSDRNTQVQFNYRDLSKPVPWTEYADYRRRFGEDYVFRVFDDKGLPTYEVYDGEGCVALPDGYSILPFFPGYKFEFGKSTYLGEEIGEGGRVYAEPGIHENVWDGDIASQHPHSVIAEVLFGPKYTKIFTEIVEARVAIKHKDFERAGQMLNGVLKPWLNDDYAKGLAQALKIVINSIYGLTSAKFTNRFRDERNVDNIVAKRGALFMTLLKSEVQKRGFTVAHIKTDSIKIENTTDDIREFVVKFGHEYGYDFETEAEFDKFCLVNDAVYVAKYKEPLKDKDTDADIWWTATGKQFQVPYVFKTLFSGEDPVFNDFCETMAVSKGAITIDMNENLPQLTAQEEKELGDILKLDDPEAKVSKEKILKRYGLTEETVGGRLEELRKKEEVSHNYIFVGRVGQFCPIVPGGGGGVLYRYDNNKYYALSGTTGFRWLESEVVKNMDKQDQIDRSYYDILAQKAIQTIDEVGNNCGWGGYLKLVGKEPADSDWPPETPQY